MNFNEMNFSDKKVLIRVDFNVPLNDDFEVTDATRINAALPTIKKVIADGGKAILMSHLGRPKNGPEEKFSLKHILPTLSEAIGKPVNFANDCIGAEAVKEVLNLESGEILLLENLRFYAEEKAGDKTFAEKLSKFGDIYLNDAFGTAHRAHASTTVVAQFFNEDSRAFGSLLSAEIENLNKVLAEPKAPTVAIIGGAKISGKIDVIKNVLPKVDHLLIGGGMAYTFLKAQGFEIGNSLIEEDKIELAKELIEQAKSTNVQLHIPVDSIAADDFSETAKTYTTSDENVETDWMGLDIGPKTIENYLAVIANAKTILWNGPMGVFEMEKFQKGTVEVAKAIGKATSNGAYSLIGGGYSVAAIKKFELQNQVSYISTGGGAMLEYLEGKELPGVKAILG